LNPLDRAASIRRQFSVNWADAGREDAGLRNKALRGWRQSNLGQPIAGGGGEPLRDY